MPAAKAGTGPLYLIVGDDERGKDELIQQFQALVPEDVRAFNLERVSALDTDPATIVSVARTIPLLGDRRVIIVARAERWLTPKRKGKSDDADDADDADDVAAPAGKGSDPL